jgi:hypothetical protein
MFQLGAGQANRFQVEDGQVNRFQLGAWSGKEALPGAGQIKRLSLGLVR